MAADWLFGYKLPTKNIYILLILTLFIGVTDGRERRTVVVQARQAVRRRRSGRRHDKRLWLQGRDTFALRSVWSAARVGGGILGRKRGQKGA